MMCCFFLKEKVAKELREFDMIASQELPGAC